MTKKYKKDPNITNFSDYALRNLPEEILTNLSFEQIQFILIRPHLVSTYS